MGRLVGGSPLIDSFTVFPEQVGLSKKWENREGWRGLSEKGWQAGGKKQAEVGAVRHQKPLARRPLPGHHYSTGRSE